MHINVEILPWLSTSMRPGTTGRIKFSHELAGSTFRDLLVELAGVDPAFSTIVYDREAGELKYPVLVIVNDRLLELLHGLETTLSAGDTVTFMATYTGG